MIYNYYQFNIKNSEPMIKDIWQHLRRNLEHHEKLKKFEDFLVELVQDYEQNLEKAISK